MNFFLFIPILNDALSSPQILSKQTLYLLSHLYFCERSGRLSWILALNLLRVS